MSSNRKKISLRGGNMNDGMGNDMSNGTNMIDNRAQVRSSVRPQSMPQPMQQVRPRSMPQVRSHSKPHDRPQIRPRSRQSWEEDPQDHDMPQNIEQSNSGNIMMNPSVTIPGAILLIYILYKLMGQNLVDNWDNMLCDDPYMEPNNSNTMGDHFARIKNMLSLGSDTLTDMLNIDSFNNILQNLGINTQTLQNILQMAKMFGIV